MSRKVILTLATAATIAAACLASTAADARGFGGGGGFGGGHFAGGGGFGGGTSRWRRFGGRGNFGGGRTSFATLAVPARRLAASSNFPAAAPRLSWASRLVAGTTTIGHWFWRDGRWIVLDDVGVADAPVAAAGGRRPAPAPA